MPRHRLLRRTGRANGRQPCETVSALRWQCKGSDRAAYIFAVHVRFLSLRSWSASGSKRSVPVSIAGCLDRFARSRSRLSECVMHESCSCLQVWWLTSDFVLVRLENLGLGGLFVRIARTIVYDGCTGPFPRRILTCLDRMDRLALPASSCGCVVWRQLFRSLGPGFFFLPKVSFPFVYAWLRFDLRICLWSWLRIRPFLRLFSFVS